MKRLMQMAVVIASALPTLLSATTKSYDVTPYRNCIGQTDTTPPNNKVTQYYRNTLDSITKVSVWIGDTFTGGRYSVEVKDGNTVIAGSYNVLAHKPWSWLDFDFAADFVKPVRGKDYAVVVTREGNHPISFAYDPRKTTYAYGCLCVGSTVHDSWDLALRIYGVTRPVGERYFGSSTVMPP